MKLRINQLLFEIQGLERADIPDNSQLFITDEPADADVVFTFRFVDNLPLSAEGWHTVFSRYNMQVQMNDGRQRRQISIESPEDAYAVYEEESASSVNVWFRSSLKADLKFDTVFISCLSLERHFSRLDAYLLHCAHLSYQGGAILFSGPSGAGKSTQADIWCRTIADTHVVNGDRALISRAADGRFWAHGWPVCGSSGICRVESEPIRALVFIEQTPLNHIIDESRMALFRRLASQLTMNHWDTQFTSRGLDFALDLASRVPMLVYGCNMNDDASETLRLHLFQ